MKMMYANFFMPQIFGAFDFVLQMHIILQRYCALESCHGCSKCILLMVHMSLAQAAAGN